MDVDRSQSVQCCDVTDPGSGFCCVSTIASRKAFAPIGKQDIDLMEIGSYLGEYSLV